MRKHETPALYAIAEPEGPAWRVFLCMCDPRLGHALDIHPRSPFLRDHVYESLITILVHAGGHAIAIYLFSFP